MLSPFFMPSVPLIHNLLAYQGSMLTETIEFRHALWVRERAAKGVSEIKIHYPNFSLLASTVLKYNYETLTLAEPVTTASDSILLSDPIAKPIALNELIPATLEDFTGLTFAAKAKLSYGGSEVVTLTCSVPSAGVLSFSLTDEQAALLPYNCTFDDLPKDERGQIDLNAVQDKDALSSVIITLPDGSTAPLYDRGYLFDCESSDTDGNVLRRVYGRLFVAAEATV